MELEELESKKKEKRIGSAKKEQLERKESEKKNEEIRKEKLK